MKKIHILSMLIIAMAWLANSAHAAEFKEGLAAYNAGNYEQAYEIFTPLAEAGDAKAQHLLGHMYIEGDGVERDVKQGLLWFRMAAKQGVKIEEDYGKTDN